ncbi:hypothetical protein [Saccharopolyspora sp. CA-218241]
MRDAISCLGGSLAHLLGKQDRREALAEFHAELRPGGVLSTDRRT